MKKIFKKTSRDKLIFGFLSLGIIGIILVALIIQYGFNFQPCPLCIIERNTWLALLFLMTLGYFKSNREKFVKFVKRLVMAGSFLGFMISTYHVAVERHWVSAPAFCKSSDTKKATSVNELRTTIMEKKGGGRCDEIPLEILGISLAIWTTLAFLSLFLLGLYLKFLGLKNQQNIRFQ